MIVEVQGRRINVCPDCGVQIGYASSWCKLCATFNRDEQRINVDSALHRQLCSTVGAHRHCICGLAMAMEDTICALCREEGLDLTYEGSEPPGYRSYRRTRISKPYSTLALIGSFEGAEMTYPRTRNQHMRGGDW